MPRPRLNPTPVSIEDELIDYFTSDQPGKKRWFGRKMKEQTPEVQERVWKKLESKGYARPVEEKQQVKEEKKEETRTVIVWTDEEWDALSEAVWTLRKNNPTETLVGLCKRALEKFPENRRRNIRVHTEIQPLIARLLIIDQRYSEAETNLKEAETKIQTLELKLQAVQTRDAILGNVTDEEVEVYFGERVIDLLPPDDVLKRYNHETLMSYLTVGEMIGGVVKAVLETYVDKQNQMCDALSELAGLIRQQKQQPTPNTTQHNRNKHSMPVPKPQPKLLRVTILGLLSEQARIVEERLKGRAQFNFVDKNLRTADAVPANQDIIVLAANFIGHSTQTHAKKKAGPNTKIIVHYGGTDTMIRKLDALLPQPEFAA